MVNDNLLKQTKDEFLKRGYMPIFENIERMIDKLPCKDSEGYIVYSNVYHLKEGKTPDRFSKLNPNTIHNIELWMSKNHRTDILLSEEFFGADKFKLDFKCCKNHYFSMTWKHYKQFHGCPHCNKSLGEDKISRYLMDNKTEFIYQKQFDDLEGINGGKLSYDFYIPTYNTLIEYQGEYHDGNVRNQTIEKLISQQEHDKRKREYAKDKNIKLIEIWYWDYKNINNILKRCVM